MATNNNQTENLDVTVTVDPFENLPKTATHEGEIIMNHKGAGHVPPTEAPVRLRNSFYELWFKKKINTSPLLQPTSRQIK
jgi:hypothetical protein